MDSELHECFSKLCDKRQNEIHSPTPRKKNHTNPFLTMGSPGIRKPR